MMKSSKNLSHDDMHEILLLKCKNSICADEIVDLLNAHNIACNSMMKVKTLEQERMGQ